MNVSVMVMKETSLSLSRFIPTKPNLVSYFESTQFQFMAFVHGPGFRANGVGLRAIWLRVAGCRV